jgi:hypothetical protein
MSKRKFVIIGIAVTVIAIVIMAVWIYQNRLSTGSRIIPEAVAPTVESGQPVE